MSGMVSSSFVAAARALAPQIQACADESERTRRLPEQLVAAMTAAGLFRLWIPHALGGEETDPMTLVQVVEEISRSDGATGWCLAIGGEYGVFGGYLPGDAAQEIYGSDPDVITGGQLRPAGQAVAVEGGYRVSGRWPLGSGCQHAHWIASGCQIFDGDQPRLRGDGLPVTRIVFFPAAAYETLDTWHSIGLHGTGSHDYVVTDLFVPGYRSVSLREPPVAPGPLYAMPTSALFGAVLAAVPLGIARHAIELLTQLAGSKITARTRQLLRENATLQADLGHAEALLRSGRAFLYQTLTEIWQQVNAGDAPGVTQRAMLWLASTHAANAAKQATELMFSAGGSVSPYVSGGLERCMRDIHAATQHLTIARPNYGMAGQAFLGLDMRKTPLLMTDGRGFE